MGDPVQVYAAEAVCAMRHTRSHCDHEARTGQKVVLTFAASGLLRERIEQRRTAQVFASADNEAPAAPGQPGQWQAPRRFRAIRCARWRRVRWR